jgi:uncharacterized protein (UPF0128 family)
MTEILSEKEQLKQILNKLKATVGLLEEFLKDKDVKSEKKKKDIFHT